MSPDFAHCHGLPSLSTELLTLSLDNPRGHPTSPRTTKRPPNPIATGFIAGSPPHHPSEAENVSRSLAKRPRLGSISARLTPKELAASHPEPAAESSKWVKSTRDSASCNCIQSESESCASLPLPNAFCASSFPSSPPSSLDSTFSSRVSFASCAPSPMHSPMHSPISPVPSRVFSTQQPAHDGITEPRAVALGIAGTPTKAAVPPRAAGFTQQHGFPQQQGASPWDADTSPIAVAASCIDHALHLGPPFPALSPGILLPPSLLGSIGAPPRAQWLSHGLGQVDSV